MDEAAHHRAEGGEFPDSMNDLAVRRKRRTKSEAMVPPATQRQRLLEATPSQSRTKLRYAGMTSSGAERVARFCVLIQLALSVTSASAKEVSRTFTTDRDALDEIAANYASSVDDDLRHGRNDISRRQAAIKESPPFGISANHLAWAKGNKQSRRRRQTDFLDKAFEKQEGLLQRAIDGGEFSAGPFNNEAPENRRSWAKLKEAERLSGPRPRRIFPSNWLSKRSGSLDPFSSSSGEYDSPSSYGPKARKPSVRPLSHAESWTDGERVRSFAITRGNLRHRPFSRQRRLHHPGYTTSTWRQRERQRRRRLLQRARHRCRRPQKKRRKKKKKPTYVKEAKYSEEEKYPSVEKYPKEAVKYSQKEEKYPKEEVKYPKEEVKYPQKEETYAKEEYPKKEETYPKEEAKYPETQKQEEQYSKPDEKYPNKKDEAYPKEEAKPTKKEDYQEEDEKTASSESEEVQPLYLWLDIRLTPEPKQEPLPSYEPKPKCIHPDFGPSDICITEHVHVASDSSESRGYEGEPDQSHGWRPLPPRPTVVEFQEQRGYHHPTPPRIHQDPQFHHSSGEHAQVTEHVEVASSRPYSLGEYNRGYYSGGEAGRTGSQHANSEPEADAHITEHVHGYHPATAADPHLNSDSEEDKELFRHLEMLKLNSASGRPHSAGQGHSSPAKGPPWEPAPAGWQKAPSEAGSSELRKPNVVEHKIQVIRLPQPETPEYGPISAACTSDENLNRLLPLLPAYAERGIDYEDICGRSATQADDYGSGDVRKRSPVTG